MEENNVSLQKAPADDLDGRFLLFNIGDSLYSISLRLVTEIIQVQTITQLPNVPYYVKGIVNLRGKVVPVIDVRLKLGLPERPYDDQTCIIVVEIKEMQIGLISDNVSEVVAVDPDDMAHSPEVSTDGVSYLSSVSVLGDKRILNLDFDKFFHDDLMNI